MRKFKLSEFEVKVLDEEEREKAISLIRNLTMERVEKLKSLKIPYARGMSDGFQFFLTAQTFEFSIHNLPLETNLKITPVYLSLMNKLIEKDPDFFEYYFLKGKIRLHALREREDFVIGNREQLEGNLDLQNMKKEIIREYIPMREDFMKALDKFLELRKSYDELLDFYKTKIDGDLGISYKRETFFRARASPRIKTGLDFDIVDDLLIPAKASVDIYRRLLSNNIFSDKEEAAKVLFNLGNIMKLFMSKSIDEFRKGLHYCEESKKILGSLPEIEEAIGYYNEALASHYDVKCE